MKDSKMLDSEYNQILDWVTELVKAAPSKYDKTNETLDTARNVKKQVKESLLRYQKDLEQEVKNRDLGSNKIRDSSILSLEVPKYRGYGSPLDFYTFKSEFEKLISPKIHARLLPDYLKNNYLEGQAFAIVSEIKEIDNIWERLKTSFGNVEILLNNKLSETIKNGPLWKIKSDEKLIQIITKLINGMKELNELAQKHGIEEILFHPSNLVKIYDLIGKSRQIKCVEKIKNNERNTGNKMSIKQKWEEIILFLDSEMKVKEEMLLLEKSKFEKNDSSKFNDGDDKRKSYNCTNEAKNTKCVICGKNDHVTTLTRKGKLVINYFACPKFVEMNPKQRLNELRSKGLCVQCLNPGFKKGHEGFCFNKFNCPDESHKKFETGFHFLVCDQHKNDPENLKLLEQYKSKHITGSNNRYEDFSKNIAISFHAGAEFNTSYGVQKITSDIDENLDLAIYMLQTIQIQGKKFNLFFDSGCGDLVCKKDAASCLEGMGRASKILDGPITLSGVGDNKTVCEHGVYSIKIPLHDGRDVNLSGICLNKVTGEFPMYPLNEVERDLHKAYASKKGDPKKLPKLPQSVGGDTDLMIGIQYLKYFPKKIFSLPNGLSIYESQFLSSDGSRGLVGGPHKVFTEIHSKLKGNHLSMSAYFTNIVNTYQNRFKIGLDVPLLGFEVTKMLSCPPNDVYLTRKQLKLMKRFEEAESAGSEVSYRCVRCRGCPDCKRGERIDCISIQEEVEQTIIDKSVTVNLEQGCTSAKLPFLCDPTQKLTPNKYQARKIYDSQVKKLNLNPNDKLDVICSEQKLQELGYVDFLENLTMEQQNKITSSPVNYFIPWRSVWNMNSLTTRCRLVYDASHPTSTGVSLNSILPKGRNNMNRLVEIVIRWQVKKHAFHTDIRKMYNTIKLDEDHWCYQLYLWENDLDPKKEPLIKVIKTLIYGVKPSGNQAERGIRETGNLMKANFPRQNEIINKDIYVDDCISGEDTHDLMCESTDGLKIVLNKGGFDLKGFTFSGFDPPKELKNEDNSINVAGMKWYPKPDVIGLNIGELNFGRKNRGKKVTSLDGLIPGKFTRRDCAGKVAEIFDLLGKVTPITAGLKLDLRELTLRNLEWDDYVPDDLKNQWISNFKIIRSLGEIKFKRALVPEDAINLDIETIEVADASQNLACSAVYVRFKRKNGNYSCQLLFGRSKIIPKNMTLPRAELFAALLNATTGHVASLSLKPFIKHRVHLTDSQITLFWINNTKSQMKQWVRNRVIEINRLTNRENWYYVSSENMTADIGTRKGAKIEDISENSLWQNGHDWAQLEKKDFPIKSVHEIKLNDDNLKLYNDESLVLNDEWISEQLTEYSNSYPVITEGTCKKINERYTFSNYVIDPNKFRLRKVVRILALVFLFIHNTKLKAGINYHTSFSSSATDKLPSQFNSANDKYLVTQEKHVINSFPFYCKKGLVIILTDDLLLIALRYFYKKATLEIRHFLPTGAFKNISREKDEILYFTGRILESQEITGKVNLSDVCLDLTMSSFCVPLVDRYSPFAYALVNEVHWYNTDVRHSGNETVLRYVQSIAYIIEGRSLIKQFKRDCTRCKILNKKAIDVAMGPISDDNLCIAPAFFISQIDIFGPFQSYSNVNKRSTIKVWFTIFCCCTTGAIDIKVMENYSTSSFILAFVRFSCKVGYPKKLLPDYGSQLVKGCETMCLTFSDIKNKLHVEYGVQFETCPVGAHYVHGKVERKIKHVKESFSKCFNGTRLSIIQWETLGNEIANSINNMPIALGNLVQDLEHLDILTPNRLLLARNNSRCPVGSLTVTDDSRKIIQANNQVFETWFKCWLTSIVPKLMSQPKWFKSDRDSQVGDIVLFLKSEKEFDKQYQYGIITSVKLSKDGKVREIEVEYQNHTEAVKRRTIRSVREVVVIHPVDDMGLVREINRLPQILNN